MAYTGKLVSAFWSFAIFFRLTANAAGAPEISGSRNVFQASGECRFRSIRIDGTVATWRVARTFLRWNEPIHIDSIATVSQFASASAPRTPDPG